MLGKRKRSTVIVRRSSERETSEDPVDQNSNTHDVFRQYFEAQFDPLPETTPVTPPSVDEDSAESDSGTEDLNSSQEDEFSGFSDQEAQIPVVEVVDAAVAEDSNAIDKIFKKSFMSSKPPTSRDIESIAQKPSATSKDEDEEDATNLKNDLDLQRLLRESHLLSQSATNSNSNPLSLQGKHRHQATDLRLLDLGSRTSLYSQEKMPMAHRRGIKAKASTMEERRRRDAKENGVILEKPTGKGKIQTRRERGVDVPVLGRFKGGTLSLSKADISSITGPSRTGGIGGKKGKRRR